MNNVYSLYFGFQTALATAWWAVLVRYPPARAWFRPLGAPDATLLAFALPDAVFFVGAGACAAYGIARGRGWARAAVLAHGAAATYAFLYCALLAVLTGNAWLSVALMAPAATVPWVYLSRHAS